MKNFEDLKYGDKIYILRIDSISRTIKNSIKTFSTKTGGFDGAFTVYFKDSADMLRVEGASNCRRIDPSGTNKDYIYYFSDIYAAEELIKSEAEKAREYIRNLEETYMKLWNPEEEGVMGEWKKGDALYISSYECVALYDGKGMLYFPDGDELMLSNVGDSAIRKADRQEIHDYFEIANARLATAGSILYANLKRGIESCGYRFNGDVIEKE